MENKILQALVSVDSAGFYPASLQALITASIFRREKKPVLWIVKSADDMYKAQ